MECIFCRNRKSEDDFSKEHIFPDSIGGTLCIDSVCKDCNDYLGHSIDNHLCDHLLIQFERLLRKIPGKSGKIPNPLEKGVLADGSGRTIYKINSEGKPEGVYLVPSVTRSKVTKGKERVRIVVDATDKNEIPKILKKIEARTGGKFSHDAVSCFKEEFIPNPLVHYSAQIHATSYERAILKIAYELAWLWLGQKYLNDPTAEILRACIMDKSLENHEWSSKYSIRGSIDLITPEIDRFPWWKRENDPHVAFMVEVDNFIGCYVRIFKNFDAMITVSEDSSRYPGFIPKFLAISTDKGTRRELPFYEELERLREPIEKTNQEDAPDLKTVR